MEVIKTMIAEELWNQHMAIQAAHKEHIAFYEKYEEILLDLDEKRQAIVKKYYQTDENGDLLTDNNGQYKLKKNVNVQGYDAEMVFLMNSNVNK